MQSICEAVAERVALGDPLAELDEHVSSCPRCRRVVAMPGQLGATRHSVDPGLGFSARMTVGAQQRIVLRRRRRIAAGLAATVAAGMLGVFAITRQPEAQQIAQEDPAVAERLPTEESVLDDNEVAFLVEIADVKRSRRVSAHWSRIQRPLAAYKQLVEDEGETP
jgi:hypothetical protein